MARQNTAAARKPERETDGRWKPGTSPNPGGRPKGLARQVREQYPEDELVRGMIRVAKGLKVCGHKPTLAEIVDARKWLADRGWGKAAAFEPIAGDPLELSDVDRAIDEAVDELAAAREAKAARPPAARALAGESPD